MERLGSVNPTWTGNGIVMHLIFCLIKLNVLN
ncbi:MAG: hypothetical protein Hyperionvirus16_54 [Hyperionvirus sp.]|uniref:Uncharacterized protein n=1 Tax=Hyperionvirus sp. TaxID=2487770 RepID=A0A3G5AFC6_9VIRU|nr:MAG: hypothetical protein Hyperionvirus16_54 [Hyperionvirus sp.]